MAATEPQGPSVDGPPSPVDADRTAGTGDEPLSADLRTRGTRVPTRVLAALVLVLVVLLVASGVVAFVVLHQPRLTPVPVPSVSSIS